MTLVSGIPGHTTRIVLLLCSLLASACLQPASQARADAGDPLEPVVQPVSKAAQPADPWLWMATEQERLGDWLSEQESRTAEFLGALPDRRLWRDQLARVRTYPQLDLPRPHGQHDYVFFDHGGDDHFSLYAMQLDSLEDCAGPAVCRSLPESAQLVLQVNDWPGEQRLHSVAVHPDGSELLYAREQIGTGSLQWYLRDLSGAEWPLQPAANANAELMWSADGQAVLALTEGEEPTLSYADREHLQDGAAAFRPVLRLPAQSRVRSLDVAEPGVFLLIQQSSGEQKLLLWSSPRDEPLLLAQGWLDFPRYIGTRAHRHYFLSTAQSWQGELWSVQAGGDGAVSWRRELSTQAGRLHTGLVTERGLLLETLEHAASQLLWLEAGPGDALASPQRVLLPHHGRINGMSRDRSGAGIRIAFSGPVEPPGIHHLDTETLQLRLLWQAPLTEQDNDLGLRRIMVVQDGAPDLPLYIAGRESVLQSDEGAPLMLEAYGGFDLPVELDFSPARLAWIQQGGLVAVAGVRGGGEYGERWYREGQGVRRGNSVEDLLAVIRYLQHESYAGKGQLALLGRSHGALLMAATAAEAVERGQESLIAALALDSAVLDLLRFPQQGVGSDWVAEYGDPADPETADFLRQFSPYHRVLRADRDRLPPTLLVTARDDPVVAPWHSFKYVAARQTARAEHPVLLRLNSSPGHETTAAVVELIEDYADRWAFLAFHTGLTLSGSSP